MLDRLKNFVYAFKKPALFLGELKDKKDFRWGEAIRIGYDENDIYRSKDCYFMTVYDIMWEDGTIEKNVPTHMFQWDGQMFVRNV